MRLSALIFQKQACVKVNGAPALLGGDKPVKRAEPAKAAQKKAPVAKIKPKEVIKVSPDTDEETWDEVENNSKQEEAVKKRKDEGSSRKKNRALTSVLTARSKVIDGYRLTLYR